MAVEVEGGAGASVCVVVEGVGGVGLWGAESWVEAEVDVDVDGARGVEEVSLMAMLGMRWIGLEDEFN